MNARTKRTLPPLFAVALTCLCYGYSLNSPMVWDDRDVVTPGDVRLTIRDIPSYFAPRHWLKVRGVEPRPYRPLRDSYLAVMSDLSHGATWPFHAGNLLLQSANVLLVFLLCRRLLRDEIVAGLAAAVFAVHPIHGEVIAWTKNAAELLTCLMGLGAALLFMGAHDGRTTWPRGRRRWLIAAAVGLYGLALLCKESVLCLPALLALWAALWLAGESRRRALLATLPFWVAGLLNAALQYAFVSTRASFGASPEAITLGGRLLLCADTVGQYLRALVFPIHHEPLPFFWPVYHSTPAQFFLLLLIACALGSLLVVHVAHRRQWAYGFWWMLLALAPVSNFVNVNSGRPVAEQRAYLPSLGFALFLGTMVAAQSGGGRKGAQAALILIVCAFAALSLSARPHWESNLQFWRWTLRTNPEIPISGYNMAVYYTVEAQSAGGDAAVGFLSRAKATALDVLWRGALGSDAASTLGDAYGHGGEFKEAARFHREAMLIDPQHPRARFLLGIDYMQMGKKEKAAEEMRLAAASPGPNQAEAQAVLARLYAELGRKDEALIEARKALAMSPDSIGLHKLAAELGAEKGLAEEAAREWDAVIALSEKAIRRQPDDLPTILLLGEALINQKKDPPRGRALLQHALRLAPDDENLRKRVAALLSSP
jgi:protein O-mannosyl-transferase